MANHSSKKMGLVMLTTLVAGNMLGSGVFLLPAGLAKLGTVTIFSWIITSVGAFLLAAVFARMSLWIPKAGGPYVYAYKGFGRFIGFQTAYCYWVALWVGNSAIAIAAIGYARVLWPALDSALNTAIAAIVILWVFTIINTRGARVAGWTQVITFICKITPLIFVGIGGWWFFNYANVLDGFNVSGKPIGDVVSHGVSLTLWAFIGVESATVGAERAKNPQRNVPLATILGTAIAAVIYIVTSFVIMGMVPQKALAASASPFALAATIILGNWGKYLVAVGAILSCLGALNGWILLQGQVAMNAAQDHFFPKFFAKKNRYEVPMLGIAVTSVLITALLLFTMSPNLVKQFNFIILLAVFAELLPYFYSSMAYIIMSRKLAKNSFKFALHLIVACLAGAYTYWAVIGIGHQVAYLGLLFVITSFPLFAFLVWKKD